MKILLFGGSGQLGYEIQTRSYDLNFEVVSPVASEINISEGQQVAYLAEQIKPDLIVNCAAYTLVDKAEEERETAHKINCIGARNVAQAAKAINARLIHISTDYVFDGETDRALDEEHQTNPLNVYGQTKLEGEREIQKLYSEGSLILRTSSLYGQRGQNFVRTMLDLFRTKDTVRVVKDQIMSPTWAGWLAEVILDLGRINVSGIVHASCAGETSWFDFAAKILELSKDGLGNDIKVKLEPITAAEFSRPAKRPRYSVLDTSKLAGILGRKAITWEEGLERHLKEIGIKS